MKYTIEGFSQEYAATLNKDFEVNGKTIRRKVDCTDLVILRWFVDFYPNMKKVEVDGKQYAWLTHKKLLEDLPIVDISKRAFIDRMKKLVDFEILTYKLLKDGGTFSLYGFGKNYENLIANVTRMQLNSIGVARSNVIGAYVQPTNKDKSIIDKSIIDNVKKERKPTTYDAILSAVKNDSLRDLFYEFIKMRKLSKSPMTDRALQMLVDKVFKLEPSDTERQKQLLENAILNNWKSVYPLKDEKTSYNKSKINSKFNQFEAPSQTDKFMQELQNMYE